MYSKGFSHNLSIDNRHHTYCFNGHGRTAKPPKTINFYLVRALPHLKNTSFNTLHFDEFYGFSQERPRSVFDRMSQYVQIYFDDIFPITPSKTTIPTSISSIPSPKQLSSRNNQELNNYVRLKFSPLDENTKQFIEKYSSDKRKNGNGIFDFKKYPQHVSCLALRGKFAEKISKELEKLPRLDIDSSFIYFYNAKKEKINLSKNYNLSIKQLCNKQKIAAWLVFLSYTCFIKSFPIHTSSKFI